MLVGVVNVKASDLPFLFKVMLEIKPFGNLWKFLKVMFSNYFNVLKILKLAIESLSKAEKYLAPRKINFRLISK